MVKFLLAATVVFSYCVCVCVPVCVYVVCMCVSVHMSVCVCVTLAVCPPPPPPTVQLSAKLNERNEADSLPIELALRVRCHSIAETLVSHGCNLDMPNDKVSSWFSGKKRTKEVRLLLLTALSL